MAFARAARRPLGVFVYSASRRFSCGNEYSTTVASKFESLSQYKSSVPSGYANPVRGFGNFMRSFSSEAPAVVDQMSLIKQLRQRTSAPIKDVKASLVECNWDIGKHWLGAPFFLFLVLLNGCFRFLAQRLLRRI